MSRDLDQRLAARRRIEALHNKGGRAHGRGDFVLRHEHLVAPAIRIALSAVGLYRRGVKNALRPVVRHLKLTFPELPPGFDGFRILHLSDFHVDGLDGLAETAADLVSRLPADLCVMTGDYRFAVDGSSGPAYAKMKTIVSRIQAHHGILAVLGNHDLAEMAQELEAMGVRLLLNEAVELRQGNGSVWVAGVDDPHFFGCDDLEASLAPVPPGAFKILLAHSPEMFEEASRAGVQLYLCGHTHGGQINLPWVGPVFLNAACPRAYSRGEWKHSGMQGYTNAGLGVSLAPVRFHCPPEAALIELGRG